MWLCVRTYSSLFGEGIMRDERPTSTQNRMKGRARREGVHLQTAGGFSLPSPLLFCSPAPFSERFSSRVPHRTMRAYVFFVGIFLASVAPLGTERQPPPVTATTLAEAVPCSASRAVQDHTLLSSSLVPLRSQFCKLLVVTSCSPRQLPRSRLHHMSYVCVCVCVWTVQTVEGSCSVKKFHLNIQFSKLLDLQKSCWLPLWWVEEIQDNIPTSSLMLTFNVNAYLCSCHVTSPFSDNTHLLRLGSSDRANKWTWTKDYTVAQDERPTYRINVLSTSRMVFLTWNPLHGTYTDHHQSPVSGVCWCVWRVD